MAIGPISGQGRQFRFAMNAMQRQVAFRYHASFFYSWRYAGAVPERLLIAPKGCAVRRASKIRQPDIVHLLGARIKSVGDEYREQ